jgi:hypothetical protein
MTSALQPLESTGLQKVTETTATQFPTVDNNFAQFICFLQI